MIKEWCFIGLMLASFGLISPQVSLAETPSSGPASVPPVLPSVGLTNPNDANPTVDAPKPDMPPIAMPTVTIPGAPTLDVKAYVLMDAATGKVLASYNPDQRLAPASLTKMMTAFVVSMALHNNKVHLDDAVPITEKAWRTGGSKMFVKVNTAVPVSELMQGIIVDSGNDACVAMAEDVAGSEEAFALMMNQTAAALGMTGTHFVDSTGLPNPDHYSTADDLAVLARALIYDFPEHYQWYSQKWFSYNGIKQPNRNRLLWRDNSVDGVKTGHTDEAGYCLVSSAQRNGVRLIAVIMGAPTDAARADDSQRLLDYGFRFFETHLIYPANTVLSQVRVYQGRQNTVAAGVDKALVVSVLPGQYSKLQLQLQLNTSSLHAPVQKGQVLGQISVSLAGNEIDKVPVVALENDAVGSWWQRLWDRIVLFFHKK